MFQVLIWRILKPRNTTGAIFSNYFIFGLFLLIYLILYKLDKFKIFYNLVIYTLSVASFILTYPAIESDSVTFQIQKYIKNGANNRSNLYDKFDYNKQIGNRLMQLQENKFIDFEDDKIIVLNKGKKLAAFFRILNLIYNKSKGG